MLTKEERHKQELLRKQALREPARVVPPSVPPKDEKTSTKKSKERVKKKTKETLLGTQGNKPNLLEKYSKSHVEYKSQIPKAPLSTRAKIRELRKKAPNSPFRAT